ncbi:MAG: hypothetical protein ACTS5A_01360 [Candidatus Hodgkinia cicadicola]
MLTYVWDLSINGGEVTLLRLHWKDDCALRLAPIALSYELDDVLVKINVDGYKHLKFIDGRMGHPPMVKLFRSMRPKQQLNWKRSLWEVKIQHSVGHFRNWNCMEVDIMVNDFNPTTNVINLELSEGGS